MKRKASAAMTIFWLLLAVIWVSLAFATLAVPAWRYMVLPWQYIGIPIAVGIALGLFVGFAISLERVRRLWQDSMYRVLLTVLVVVIVLSGVVFLVPVIYTRTREFRLPDLVSFLNIVWSFTVLIVVSMRLRFMAKQSTTAD